MKPYYTLKEILNNHLVADLKEIGKSISIKGYYSMKKDDLIAAISDHILDENNLQMSFLVANDKDIENFELALKGREHVENPLLYRYWEDLSLAFITIEDEVHIPLEVKKQYLRIKKLKKYQKARERTRIIDSYALACTNLYSVIDVKKLVEIINSQTSIAVEVDEVINWCITREHYGNYNMYFYENGYIMNDAYGYSSSMDDMDYEKMLKMQEGKPYYIPDREELLRYKDDLYIEENESFKNMLNYMRTKLKIGAIEAYDYCADIQLGIRSGYMPSDILNDCERTGLSFNNKKQAEVFIKYLMDMFNNTRIRENRGYTPNEIYSIISTKDIAATESNESNSNVIPFPQEKNYDTKIPRNAPCPCGSGKKYKKCCGKN